MIDIARICVDPDPSYLEFITLAHAAGIVKLGMRLLFYPKFIQLIKYSLVGESRWGPTVSLQKKWRNWMDV